MDCQAGYLRGTEEALGASMHPIRRFFQKTSVVQHTYMHINQTTPARSDGSSLLDTKQKTRQIHITYTNQSLCSMAPLPLWQPFRNVPFT